MLSNSRSKFAPLALIGLIALGGTSLVGCSSGSSGVASTTSRRYTSSIALTNPQTAALDINVASDSTVTGTMTVNDPSRSARTRAVVLTVQLSGTIASNGDLSLTGTFTPTEGSQQTVHITGNLGTTGGNVILSYLNQTFNGTWTYQASTNPSGGGATATFSNVVSSNAITSNLSLPIVTGTNSTLPIIGKQLVVSAIPGIGDYSRGVSFGIRGGAVVGTYTIDDDLYAVHYAEGLANPRQWAASGGTLKITAADSTKVSFEIIGATMHPVSGTGTPAAAGTFTMNFSGETTALVTN